MVSKRADYLVVGAGVFGASTAYHLSKAKPKANIILIDRTPFPCPIAASHDINKAVRADYGDVFYCSNLGKRIIENFKKLNAYYEAETFGPDKMKTRFDGIFADADYSHVNEIYWNPLSGWAEAARALEATIKVAVNNGVQYIAQSVSKILLADGRCTGVQLDNSQEIHAEHVILCTGAYTAKLIADSALTWPELQVGRRIIAAAVCEAATDVSEAQKAKYEKMPVVVFDDAVRVQGETMPITPDGQMKFIRDVTWKNTVDHPASGQSFSVPLTTPDRSQWTSPEKIPLGLREEVEMVVKGIYGADGTSLMPNTLRMCWDGLTQDNNWYITPHPHCKDLYIATGGSFHGWKFLPIIGEYVVQMLEGKLPAEETERWAWDRDLEGLPRNPLEPIRELSDIKTMNKGFENGSRGTDSSNRR